MVHISQNVSYGAYDGGISSMLIFQMLEQFFVL